MTTRKTPNPEALSASGSAVPNKPSPAARPPLTDGDAWFASLPAEKRSAYERRFADEEARRQAFLVWREAKIRESTFMGAVVNVLLSVPTYSGLSWMALPLLAAGCCSGWLVARFDMGHLGGILAFGLPAMGVTLAGLYLLGGADSTETSGIFFSWLFYLVAGCLIAMWNGHREHRYQADHTAA